MKKVYIQPYWPELIFGLCGLIVGVFLLFSNASFVEPRHYRTILIAATVIVIDAVTSFILTPKGIWVLWLFIPIRLIRWYNISNAIYLHHWAAWLSYNKTKGQSIMVTLCTVLPFNPKTDMVGKFTMKHPIGSLFIRFTKRNRDRYVKAFREYFPKLTFQEGSDLHIDDP